MQKRRMDLLFTITLPVLDLLMSALAFGQAYQLRRLTPHDSLLPFGDYAGIMIIHVLAIGGVFLLRRSYYDRQSISHLDEFYHVVGSVVLGGVTSIALVSFILRDAVEYPRLIMLYALLLTIIFITVGRVILARVRWILMSRGIGRTKVLIIGSGDVATLIMQKINQSPRLGYEVVGFVDGGSNGLIMGTPVLGEVSQLPQLIDEHGIEEVIIGLPEASHEEILDIIALCERGRVGIGVFPDVFQIMASEVSIGDLGGLPLLNMRDVALRGWRLSMKRMMDMVVSATALVLLSPLMLLTALLIKLDSKGPVFFVQERTGLDGQPFPMLKFRSMREDAEADGPGWTTEDDPRRTRLGTIIRKLSIDELPQFINVLLGDMSLVGPRPEQPAYVEQFRRSIPRYMERHREKAGLTGWAQVNGLRGDTSIIERTKYDLWYIENWSLWLDVQIIIRTFMRGISGRGAY